MGLFKIVAVISFPICFAKNVISGVQLVGGMQILADLDIAQRVKSREELKED